ncbi:MAG TPA: TetR/AcrR family transcriptional regulator [Longimicrobiales bacterium]|nr:TetR/AcrR family transcriptional regulator [Longimicrobiales bacterium]
MSPRPRKASDEQIYAAAHAVINRLGPTEWTLAEVAAEAGLTAGALVQRFGSKRALMVALTEQLAGATSAMFEALRARVKSPLATVRVYAECMAQMASSPGTFAHHLSYLQRDLLDPELHRHVRDQAQQTRAELARLLAEAVAAGELLPRTDAASLARTLEVTISGSLLTWACYLEGDAADWMLHDVTAVLRSALTRKGRARLARKKAQADS